ncbi:hypothetical protein K438DRAFT_1987164 [Mycena galopus ATCC 62051]|nr:hypothetical protein K438DRAFT_1987164 [Mycena galopus ATCC 62051]
MPLKASETVEKILGYTTVAASALQDIAAVTQIPFLNSVSALSLTIIGIVEKSKIQRERYVQIVEGIHQSLCALMALCMHSDEIGSPKLLEAVAHYTNLEKLLACLRAQQGLGTFKRFFKQSEISTQLDSCEGELRAAMQIFTIKYGAGITSTLVELKADTERRHQELLELISSQSVSSDNQSSSIQQSSLNISSTDSFSLLPASPKIFYGRGPELEKIVDTLVTDAAARIAILGPGGMGKTTLAMATLHHPTLVEKYSCRYFISCESANTCAELVTKIGLHLGLEPSHLLSKAIVQHLRQCASCVVVLDNFETPWEPLESRRQVEEFLSLLADIPTLALLVTMRGAERPGKVKWNRPFLSPLEPLPSSASRQIFLEVAEDPEPGEESALDELLDLSGSLPLAVSLMANIASFEGYLGALSRWKIENISLLSDGHDKRSNLEKSITLSLSSPRLSSSPHAKKLLCLLSLLPDGIRVEIIIAGRVPIPDVRSAQALLIGTSLAYLNPKGRLTALSPIREYIRRTHPPSPSISRPLRVYFQELLELLRSTQDLPSGNLLSELVGNLGNINQLILDGLVTDDKSAWSSMGSSIIALDGFSRAMLKGASPLSKRVPHLIAATGDAGLRWKYRSMCLRHSDRHQWLNEDFEIWIKDGVEYFGTGIRPIELAVPFYDAAAYYYSNQSTTISLQKAIEFNKLAYTLAQDAHSIRFQIMCLETENNIAFRCGDPYRRLKVTHKTRDLGRYTSHPKLLNIDAKANYQIGNLSRVLDLCIQAEDILVSRGMPGSEEHLGFTEIRAVVHGKKSEYTEARQLNEQIAKTTSPTSAPLYHANSLFRIAELDILTQRSVAGILANLHAAEGVWQSLELSRMPLCSVARADLKLYLGEPGKARREFLQCLTKNRGLYADIDSLCLGALGDPRNGMHSAAETFCWAVVSLAFVQRMKDRVETLNALRRLADAHSILKDDESALNIFHAALEGGTNMDIHRLRAECMVGIGDIMLRRGDLAQAKEMWTGAYPLFVRSSRMKDAAAVQERLQQLSSKNSPLNGLEPVSEAAATVDEQLQQLPNTSLLNGPEAVPEAPKIKDNHLIGAPLH